MSLMIPDYFNEKTPSGERTLFNKLKYLQGSSDWIVLHSLNLAKHVKRLYGEIDFLILAPEVGIIILEVKSGRVSRNKGIWYYTNKFGETTSDERGPFKQARDAMFSLKKAIEVAFGVKSPLNKLLYCFGVAFPHMTERIHSINNSEFEDWQTYYKITPSFYSYLIQLAKNQKLHVKNQNWFDSVKSIPNKQDIMDIKDTLRGDFDRIPNLSTKSSEIEERINIFTHEQYIVLDNLKYYQRFICIGGAGTGKTMIAIEKVLRIRKKYKHRTILFLCYNKLLSKWLESIFNKDKQTTVSTLHSYMYQIIKSKIKYNKDSTTDYYNKLLPEKFIEHFNFDKNNTYDYIIVDEAQDLITDEFLDVLDLLLKSGLRKGKWYLFGDLENQNLFNNFSDQEMLSLINQRCTDYGRHKLLINCRNTKIITKQISMVTDLPMMSNERSDYSDIPVTYKTYLNENEQIKLIDNTLTKLKKDGVQFNDISILSEKRMGRSIIRKSKYFNKIYNMNLHNSLTIPDKHIFYSTISAYKGLENNFVLLIEIDFSIHNEFISMAYVGMSRCRIGLYWFLPAQDNKKLMKIQAQNFGKK